MKTSLLGLRTTIYKVSDLAAAKAWYIKAFGVKPYFDEPFYVGFNIAGYELGLHPESEPIKNKSDAVVAYWGVDDVEKGYQQLLKLGAVSHEAPQNVGGEIVVATLKDPWGNVLGLIYNPEFKLP